MKNKKGPSKNEKRCNVENLKKRKKKRDSNFKKPKREENNKSKIRKIE